MTVISKGMLLNMNSIFDNQQFEYSLIKEFYTRGNTTKKYYVFYAFMVNLLTFNIKRMLMIARKILLILHSGSILLLWYSKDLGA